MTIDELPEQTTPENTDMFMIQDAGQTKKVSFLNLKGVTGAPLTTHINDTVDAHNASAISATDSGSGIDSTDVQGQLGQLATAVAAAASGDFLPTSGGTVTGDVDVVGAFDVTGATSVTGGDVVLDGSHCVVAPCIPTLGDHLTNKTYVDTEISGIVAEGGGTGIVISDTPPEDTDILWADSSDESVATPDTVIVFTYTDETDAASRSLRRVLDP